MTACTSVVSLPDSFCRLSNLKKLDLRNCHELASLPERFGQLESLRALDLEDCWRLQALPAGPPPRILPLSAALAILAQIQRDISSSAPGWEVMH